MSPVWRQLAAAQQQQVQPWIAEFSNFDIYINKLIISFSEKELCVCPQNHHPHYRQLSQSGDFKRLIYTSVLIDS